MYSSEIYAPPAAVRPPQVTAIALFQFAKAAVLLLVPALAWLDPTLVRDSPFLAQLVFLASRGRDLPGIAMPAIGLYVFFIGLGLWHLRQRARRNVLFGSFVTIVISLARLGVFDSLLGTTFIQSLAEQQTVMILILFDAAVFIYLAFHPDIMESFKRRR